MSHIKPFRAFHYNLQKIKDPGEVVCPPYDVISPEDQDYFYSLDPHNFIHILLGKDQPEDDKSNNKYTRAQKTFHEWLKEGILIQDEKPALYFYKQEFKIQGQKYDRLGFIALMELRDGEESRVHPHENTHAHAIEDRLRLLRSVHANLSCIFVCYSDKHKKTEKIFNKQVISEEPMITIEDRDKVKHKLWRVTDTALIEEMRTSLADQHVFIADGHHRYQVALEYRRRKLEKESNPKADHPYNYVMTYFTNIDDRELQIFPMHRMVRRLPRVPDFMEDFFRMDRVKNKTDLSILLAQAGKNEHAFGLYMREGIKLLRLKNKMLINKYIREGSEVYRHLDATILKYFIFDQLGIESKDILYTKDLGEAIRMVDEKQADASFILNPVKISQLKTIALNQERMPPKTTYFYPKVLSGLTVYKLD